MSGGRAETGLLASFSIRSYRFQWSADLLSAWASEMETLILAWYVLIETDSAFLTSLIGALRFGGTLLSPAVGVLADRVARRSIMLGLRLAYLGIAAALAALGLSGALEPWHAIALAGLTGLARPPEFLVRQSLIADTVPVHLLTNALGFGRTTVDSARVVGALLGAALLASLGIGPAYVVVTAFYAASTLLTLGVSRYVAPRAGERTHPWQDLALGIAYIRSSAAILTLMWLAFLVNLTAFPLTQGLLPIVAREVYGLDEIGLGRLVASAALGGLTGSLLMAVALRAARPAPLMVGGMLAWYAAILVFAGLDSPAGAYAVLFAVGVANSIAMVAMSVVLMARTQAELRGRVMGVRMLAVYGLPIGLLVAGALSDRVGVITTVSVFGWAGVVLAGHAALRWRRVARIDTA